MDRLPNELVAQIASNTDNTTLLAFATTSRHLHEGSNMSATWDLALRTWVRLPQATCIIQRTNRSTRPSHQQPYLRRNSLIYLSTAGTRTDSAVMSQALVRFPKTRHDHGRRTMCTRRSRDTAQYWQDWLISIVMFLQSLLEPKMDEIGVQCVPHHSFRDRSDGRVFQSH
jgi:hypothetical protein